MKEISASEMDRWPKLCGVDGCNKFRVRSSPNCKLHQKTTKGGIMLENEDYKSYTDYLKKSSYKKEYKEFCINWYNSHRLSEIVNDEIDN